MYASTTATATMVDDAQAIYDVRVGIALPGGVYPDLTVAVESVQIDASFTTDLPEGKRIKQGVPAVTATITLNGVVDDTDSSKTVPWLFGPYQTTSPLFRKSVLQCPVTVDILAYPDGCDGVPETFRKFTGVVSRAPVIRDGTVTLTCVDMRNTWRAAPPPLLINTSGASNDNLTSEFALDAIGRQASGHASLTWPAPVSECVLAVGYRTSTFPEVGTLAADYAPTFAAGVFGSALAGGDLATSPHAIAGGPSTAPRIAAEHYLSAPYVLGGGQIGTYPNQTNTSPNMFCEFWVNGDVSSVFPQVLIGRAPSGILGGSWSPNWFRLTVKSTGLVVESSMFSAQTWSTTVAAGPHNVGWWMKSNSAGSTLDITVILDGVVHTFTQLAVSIGDVARNYVATGWSATSGMASSIEALQVSSNVSNHSINFLTSYPFTPTAFIDPSLNDLTVVPKLDGDTWSVIQQIALAELGVAGFDEAGRFFFKNRASLRQSAVVRTLTSKNAIADLTVEQSVDGVANRCRVESTPYLLGTKSTIWELVEPTLVKRGRSKTFTVDAGNPVISYDAVFSVLPNGSTDTASSYYRLSVDKAGTALASASGFSVVVSQLAGTTLQIVATNNTGRDVWMVSSADYTDSISAGTPVFRLSGAVATPGDANVADVQWPPVNADGTGGAASSLWHEVLCEITGNPWIQSSDSGDALAEFIVEDMPSPRPNFTDMAIFPDVRLQLGDRVLVADDDVHDVNEYAVLFGWSLTVRRGGLSMSADARTVVNPGGWILGVTGRSELSTTTYL